MSTTTDILDTTIPEPAWVLDPTYDSELNPELTHSRASAGRMVSDEGKYVSRASGVERVPYGFDGDPGLLVEAASRTNKVENSSDLSSWPTKSNVTLTAATSIIKGETAHKADSTSGTFNFISTSAGTTSGNPETFLFVLEEGSGGTAGIQYKQSGGTKHARLGFDWSAKSLSVESTSSSATVDQKNFRQLEATGPNGGLLIEVRFTISGVPSGQIRQVVLFPDRSGNQNFMYFHHAQLEEAPNASSPIVTQGSPVTRSADDYAIFEGGQPSWWNPNEGTFLIDYLPQVFYIEGFYDILLGSGTGERVYIGIGGSSSPFRITYNNGTNNKVFVNDNAKSFATNKIGFSFSGDDVVLSVDGSSRTNTSSNNRFYNESTELKLGPSIRSSTFEQVIYIPRALPESTLNAITS